VPPDRLGLDRDPDEVRSGCVPAVIWSRARRAGIGGVVAVGSHPVSYGPALASAVCLLSSQVLTMRSNSSASTAIVALRIVASEGGTRSPLAGEIRAPSRQSRTSAKFSPDALT